MMIGQPIVKPLLSGVRTKQRKGVQKANAKSEPNLFRDQLVKHLESISPPNDFDQIAAKLDVLGNQVSKRLSPLLEFTAPHGN